MRGIIPFIYTMIVSCSLILLHGQAVYAAGASARLPAPVAPVLPGKGDPAVNVEAGSEQAPPDASPEKPIESKKQFSFGSSNLSILFLPTQIERMKIAIRNYESVSHDQAPTPVIKTPVEVTKITTIEEPKSYPVFYLASIVYNKPGDWSLWMSGRKITSRKNETDVSVLSINANSATFLWQPSYSKAVLQRNDEASFVSTDTVKNRLATAQPITLNKDTGSVQFTLRPNQSFSVGYFKIFEGFIDTPVIEPLSANPTDVLGSSASPPPF